LGIRWCGISLWNLPVKSIIRWEIGSDNHWREKKGA
jgi:hypothetical protein